VVAINKPEGALRGTENTAKAQQQKEQSNDDSFAPLISFFLCLRV
jgi:hypothetical protein